MTKNTKNQTIAIENKDKTMEKTTTAKDKKWLEIAMLDQPVLTAPLIDKLSVVIDVLEGQLQGLIYSELLLAVELEPEQFTKMKGSSRYPLAVKMTCADEHGVFQKGNPTIFIQLTSSKHPSPQMRLEFNPNELFGSLNGMDLKTSQYLLENLDVEFEAICGKYFFDLLSRGRITRIEISRQILDRSPEDYLFRAKHKQSSSSFFGKGGQLETIYFGKSSGNQVKVYNKAKQLSGGQSPNNSIRIERTIKPKVKMTVLDLWSLPNPFDGIGVYSMYVKKPPYGFGHWTAFQDACRFRGITKAIARQPKEHRANLRKVIANHPVDWWAMDDDVWAQRWHETLEDVWFNQIPNQTMPFTMKYMVGNDAA